MTKQELLDLLQNYNYYIARIKELNEDLCKMTYKVTPTYGNLAAGTCSGNDSKVEKFSVRSCELQKKKQKAEQYINYITFLIDKSGLSERERAVMWWIAKNGNLQAYARRENIKKDNIYKIRDRAINKIISKKPQNVV